MRFRIPMLVGVVFLGLGSCALWLATVRDLRGFPEDLPPELAEVREPRFLDRDGEILSVTYENDWNLQDRVALHDVPELVRESFILAEDRRFYRHGGADWLARSSAVVQNLRARRAVRGASTITEQVVRILRPRPRTLWSRWLEGFEAGRLESRLSKAEILELYLNQVPYASRRRGVKQAARLYFDRDLDTLNPKEMLALAVLVRSPTRLDPRRGNEIEAPIGRLADALHANGRLGDRELATIRNEPLRLAPTELQVEAAHFIRAWRKEASDTAIEQTTLEGALQNRAQDLLDRSLESLRSKDVADGAVLVVDHQANEILAWVNGGGFDQTEGGQIDMVTTPRQPGSTLKPFLYALALEKGWTAATLIDDAPISESVGHGLHRFRNYSRHYYGPIRVREALGNSLNVPAIRTIRFAGRDEFYRRLRALGISSLGEHPDFYGEGLALGNGEVTLLELVNAYATLARGGRYHALKWRLGHSPESGREVFGNDVASLIGNILADPEARSREFGRGSILELPVQTAVKTGTSNDYRDAWAIGFSDRYTVGVWMGNLDRKPMRGVTGAAGPGLVLRSVFAELHRHGDSSPLHLDRTLRQRTICRATGQRPHQACPRSIEWFRPGSEPKALCPVPHEGSAAIHLPAPRAENELAIARPSRGLHLAMDPRIPDELERFQFKLTGSPSGARVEWLVNGKLVSTTTNDEGAYLWPLSRGEHEASARIWLPGAGAPKLTGRVSFLVK